MKTKRVKFYLETTLTVEIPDKPARAIETDEEWVDSIVGQKGEELAFMLDGNTTLDRYRIED